MRPGRALLCGLAAALLVSVGCDRPINRTAERRIREALPGFLGPATRWQVRIESPAVRTVQGTVRLLRIHGDNVWLGRRIRCASLAVEMSGVEFDTGRSRLRSVDSTRFAIVVDEVGLNRFLLETQEDNSWGAEVLRVELAEGRAHVRAAYRAMGIAVPFDAVVTPRLVSPTRVEFDPQSMRVMGVRAPVPRAVLQWLARRLDAGFDLRALPFPISADALRVTAGRIEAEGTADVMETLNAQVGGGK